MFSKIKNNIGKLVDSEALRDKGDELIERELPKIQKHFRETVGPVAAETINNDELMTKCFERIHKLVPLPLRLVIKKPAFVDFCMHNRHRIAGIDENRKKVGVEPQ
jgi:hypothetical protein